MMKINLNLRNAVKILVACLAVFYVGNVSAQQKISTTTTTTDVDIRSAIVATIDELNPGVRIFPFICEYEMIPKENPVSAKYTYETGVAVKKIITNIDGYINLYVKVALTKMMEEQNADAILAATNEITTVNGELVVTVKGYPVRYTNFRKATANDLWILKFEESNGNVRFMESRGTLQGGIKSTTSETIEK
jgi:hypothetical protein